MTVTQRMVLGLIPSPPPVVRTPPVSLMPPTVTRPAAQSDALKFPGGRLMAVSTAPESVAYRKQYPPGPPAEVRTRTPQGPRSPSRR
jgi:hypothetical protein